MQYRCPNPDCNWTDFKPSKVTSFDDEVKTSVCNGPCSGTYPTASFKQRR